MKIIQAIILTVGSTAILYTACVVSLKRHLDSGTIAGQLGLVSSLFAQLCAPLEYVGQHFRDCVATAEDLRELETIRRKYAKPAGSEGKQVVAAVRRQPGGAGAYPNTPARIDIKDLTFAYQSDQNNENKTATQKRNILSNVNLSVKPGGYSLGIVGPSGCGKSTLLRVLLGLEPVDTSSSSARIYIDGVDVTNADRIGCFS